MKSANSSNDADTGTGQPKKTSTSMGKTGSMKKRKRASSEDNVELGLDLSTGIERELGL